MNILGINGAFRLGYQDAAAALLRDGHLMAAVEEERLNRIKYANGQLPLLSIKEVLNLAGIDIGRVDCVAMHGETWSGDLKNRVADYFDLNFQRRPEIFLCHHHMAHAASSFYSSGFDEALIISMDGSGDGVSTQIAVGGKEGIKVLARYNRPQSLGIFYSAITQYCGFMRDSDEYKLMGLSAFGKPGIELSDFLKVEEEGYHLNKEFIADFEPGQPGPSRHEFLFSSKLKPYLGFNPAAALEKETKYANLAFAAQETLERAVVALVKYWMKKTGQKKLCLAGGVALNCLMNQKVQNMKEVEALFVPPFAGDQGISIGAAMLAAVHAGIKVQPIKTAFFGREYTNKDILTKLTLCGVKFEETINPAIDAAKLVAAGKIVAWFQGRSEFGPRALGNRSILASATIPGTKDKLNAQVKFRESFRPFCPAVLEEDFNQFFEAKSACFPFMNVTVNVKKEAEKIIPEVVHVDGSARVQTVSRSLNPLFYEYLVQLKKLTGIGLSINTSFNVRNHPIVETPENALECFFSSGLDALVIGNYILLK